MNGNRNSGLVRRLKQRRLTCSLRTYSSKVVRAALLVTAGAIVTMPAAGHHTGGTNSKETSSFTEGLVRDRYLPELEKEISGFIDELVRDGGLSRPQLEKLFKEVKYLPRVIELISKPAERRLTWGEYRNLLINDNRIERGVEFWMAHRDTLEKAEQKYGVSPTVIIGILGIETGFGQNSGGFRVVDTLSTLGFGYPRRASFFKKELKQFLILANEQGFDPLELKGSYAGAMGIPQFMPSSYRAYAIDFDGNGQTDIWNSPVDTIGSIASYLKRHGWVQGGLVAERASVQGKKYKQLLSDDPRPTRKVKEAKQFGWQAAHALPSNARVRGLELAGEDGPEYWLTLTNFYAITRYNKSDLYAMAVWQLGSQVEQRLESRVKQGQQQVMKQP